MLSSLSSLLPSALQNINPNPNSHANPPPVVDEDDEDEEVKAGESVQPKKKKDKPVHETFIIVRPPPAKSNHPLNLQVQLVPPNTRAPGVTGSVTPRQSLDGAERSSPTSTSAESETSGASLSRTTSAQSSRSEISSYSSSGHGSTTSFSSVGSTTSGRRMIIPLYNLQAHNVMTNTIVDAGTDAKIAKFTRKGLEMIDLALMEVVEVWPTPAVSARASLDDGSFRARQRLSAISNPHLRLQQPSSRPTTPDAERERLTPGSSVVSVSSAGLSAADEHHHRSPENIPSSVPIGLPPQQKKNIFGKLFKRKDSPSPVRSPTFPPASVSVTPASPDSSIKTPTFTPTHSLVPHSPSSTSRHSRNLSSSITNFGKRGGGGGSGSSSPSRPATSAGVSEGPGTGLGIGRLIKHVRPSSMHIDPNEVQAHDYAYDSSNEHETGLKPEGGGAGMSTTSSRLSTASRTSTLEPPPMSPGFSTGSNMTTPTAATAPSVVVLPATLAVQPMLSSPGGPSALAAFTNFTSAGYPPPKNLGFGRGPALYVWVIRKWIKMAEGTSAMGLFGGMKDALGGGGGMGSGLPHAGGRGHGLSGSLANLAEIEVRVEWKRGKKSKSKKRDRVAVKDRDEEEGEGGSGTSRGASVSRTRSQKRRSVIVANESSPTGSNASLYSETGERERKKKNRLSTASKASTADDPDTTLIAGGGSRFGRGRSKTVVEEDDENDSDPEDSETPWTCTLKVRRLGIPGLPLSSSSTPSNPLKLKTATLSPTPHHPKVVAMLKVPYPLPDLEVQKLELRKRPAGPNGGTGALPPLNSNGTPNLAGMVLRAEELKDVVCSTGLWVVVREGFGGVGKVSRKGDGWRIRA